MDENEKYFEELATRMHTAPPEDQSAELSVELARTGGMAARKPKLKIAGKPREEEEEAEGRLTLDVYQTPAEIIVESAVAGVDPDTLDIDVTPDSVTIRGERRREDTVKDEDYFYQECYWGKFSRSVILPQEVDAESAYATFKNGILAVHLPKQNKEKKKKLKVRVE
ncbi:MAG: Hsp20/alpha crystallin family protein [Candidatus Liptonbacteria bacterium]|nr:Hsp20/alpha crystallin family protein [Candidatus Liptonbacteria bacterium]